MELNKYIDHTDLKPTATREDIFKLCMEAKAYGFASVCVNSYWVRYCSELLKDSDVAVCTVIGFPLGAMSTRAKVLEATEAVKDGADEIDMVMNIGELKAGNDEAVLADLVAVIEAVHGICVKVILETCLLDKEEIRRACSLCVRAKASYVKTSTGFSVGGATKEDVAYMKECVKDKCKVKAAGGIRSHADMMEMLEAGADRIGTSAGVKLLK